MWQALNHLREPKFTSKIPCTKPTHTTHGACAWLRRNRQCCAQRSTVVDVDVLNPPGIHFLTNFGSPETSPTSKLLLKFFAFHVHGSDLGAVQTFHQKLFRSWYLHHLKLQNHTLGRTKGNRKRPTEFLTQTQHVKKMNQKNRPKILPIWPRPP